VEKKNNEIKKGTHLMFVVIEGKDISIFSLFPDESEILLLPNSSFIVKDILNDQFKQVLGLPSTVDVIVLSQLPTPPHLLVMKQLPVNKHEQLEHLEKLNKELQEIIKKKEKELDHEKTTLNSKISELELKIKQLEKSNYGLDQEKTALNLKINQLVVENKEMNLRSNSLRIPTIKKKLMLDPAFPFILSET